MKKSFNLAARDAAAKEYLGSEAFLTEARKAIVEQMIKKPGNYCTFQPAKMQLEKTHDMPYLQKAFSKLKEIYPDLDHVRVDKYCAVVVDTQRNTWRRRRNARSFGGRDYAW
jgi:hypothetical protein